MRASGFKPRDVAKDSRASTTAAAPSEMLAELAAVTVPSFLKAGLSAGIFDTSIVEGVSSLSMIASPLRVLVVTGATSSENAPLGDGGLRAPRRFAREFVLRLAREFVLAGGRLGKAAHQLPVPRALQSVEEHVIEHFLVPHPIARAGLRQQIGRVGHRLEAAGDDHSAEPARIWSARQHHRAHGGAAHFVDRRGGNARRECRRPSAAWRAGAWPRPADSTQPMMTSSISAARDPGVRDARP